MTPERLRQIEELYHGAREREPAEREAFLAEACRSDTELQREVESLLAQCGSDGPQGGLMARPAMEIAANLLAEETVTPLAVGTQLGPYKTESPLKAFAKVAANALEKSDTDPSKTLVDRNIGPYHVLSFVASGGMGEVYRARDTKLKRDVAIKILPDEFSRDGERVSRFQREAEVLASLNHPNIAAIYDLQEANGSRYLVLELVEGETLSDRIARGRIPVEEALDIARSICEALEAAHEKGIIHRDLKPANVKITPSGQVKVLDFGLAKVIEDDLTGLDVADLPTKVSVSMAGEVRGTPAYMSPEQARGQRVDKRADIWAFGVMLYEMLTGRRLFTGDTVTDILAAVIERQPDLTRAPLKARPLLRRCLEKDPKRRLRDIGEARFLIESSPDVEPTPATNRNWKLIAGGLAVIAAVAIVFLAALSLNINRSTQDQAAPLLRFSIPQPEGGAIGFPSISPDGHFLAFTGVGKTNGLGIRRLDSLEIRELPGTDGATLPFWSPDSRFLGFFDGRDLKTIEVGAPGRLGTALTICPAPEGRGGAWNREGVILFAPRLEDPIYQVSTKGGPVKPVTALDRSRLENSHRFPMFLPDGRHFIYWARSADPMNQGIYIGSLDVNPESQDKTRLVGTAVNAAYIEPGFLLFVKDGALLGQRFDPGRLQLQGEAVQLADHLIPNTNYARFSASPSGLLAYETGMQPEFQFVWFDRTGKRIGTAGKVVVDNNTWELSPDGNRVVLMQLDTQNLAGDIWLFDVVRGTITRLTRDPSYDWKPFWSPDASRILFGSNRRGPMNLYLRSLNAASDELLLPSPDRLTPTDWSGRFVVYQRLDPKTKEDLWVLPLDTRTPIQFVHTDHNETTGRLSPDGRWMAYVSDESGSNEVYVQAFTDANGKPTAASSERWQISIGGGSEPRWRRDGKELFFTGRGGVNVVEVTSGASFQAGSQQVLFTPQGDYDVSADGQRFLVLVPEAAPPPSTVVIVNWSAVVR